MYEMYKQCAWVFKKNFTRVIAKLNYVANLLLHIKRRLRIPVQTMAHLLEGIYPQSCAFKSLKYSTAAGIQVAYFRLQVI